MNAYIKNNIEKNKKQPSILKKLNQLLLITIPSLIVFGGIIILSFLANIQQQELFFLSISNNESFLAISLAMIIVTFFIIFLFIFPSVFLLIPFLDKNNNFIKAIKKPEQIVYSSFLLSLLFTLCVLIKSTCDSYLAFYILMLFIITYCLLFYKKKHRINHHYYLKNKNNFKKNYPHMKTLTFFMMIISCFSISYPMLIILNAFKGKKDSSMWYFIVISLFVFILVYMPIFNFISSQKRKETIKKSIIIFSSTAVTCFFILIIFMKPIYNRIIYLTLSAIGLIDDREYSFVVAKDDYPKKIFELKKWFDQDTNDIIEPVDKDNKNIIEGKFIIRGKKMYSFGNMIFLCPSATFDLMEQAYKINLDNLFDKGKNKAIVELKQKATACIILDRNKVQQISMTIIEPEREN